MFVPYSFNKNLADFCEVKQQFANPDESYHECKHKNRYLILAWIDFFFRRPEDFQYPGFSGYDLEK